MVTILLSQRVCSLILISDVFKEVSPNFHPLPNDLLSYYTNNYHTKIISHGHTCLEIVPHAPDALNSDLNQECGQKQ